MMFPGTTSQRQEQEAADREREVCQCKEADNVQY